MKIELSWDGPARHWHALLRQRLQQRGHSFVLRPVPWRHRLDLRLLELAERRIYGVVSELFRAVPSPPSEGARPDLVLTLRFGGATSENALVDTILAGRVPEIVVEARDDSGGRAHVRGRPANEEPLIFARGIEMVLARLVTLVERAVIACEIGEHLPDGVEETAHSGASQGRFLVTRFLARNLVSKIMGRLTGRSDHWAIAVRSTEDSDNLVLAPDDASSFRADPFLVEHDGRLQVFYEDFPYATRKGVIACADVDRFGGMTRPRTVLEMPTHLSYPFILHHRGATYMLPEMSATGRVQLFRAASFPDHWAADAILLEGLVAGDATPIVHDGLWWIFATLAGDGGSSWDQLGLFHAPDLFGPWTAHVANPVLIDAGAARPAGAMWHEGSTLMRVAQDCRAGYGAGLALCRVDRLDLQGFSQTVVERIGPPPGSGATGLHTSNRVAGMEALDLKWPRRPRVGRSLNRRRGTVVGRAVPRGPAHG